MLILSLSKNRSYIMYITSKEFSKEYKYSLQNGIKMFSEIANVTNDPEKSSEQDIVLVKNLCVLLTHF